MKCKYCQEEKDHKKGCPEIVTEMSKAKAIREFDAGGFSAAAYFAPDKTRSDSYQLGFEMSAPLLAKDTLSC